MSLPYCCFNNSLASFVNSKLAGIVSVTLACVAKRRLILVAICFMTSANLSVDVAWNEYISSGCEAIFSVKNLCNSPSSLAYPTAYISTPLFFKASASFFAALDGNRLLFLQAFDGFHPSESPCPEPHRVPFASVNRVGSPSDIKIIILLFACELSSNFFAAFNPACTLVPLSLVSWILAIIFLALVWSEVISLYVLVEYTSS